MDQRISAAEKRAQAALGGDIKVYDPAGALGPEFSRQAPTGVKETIAPYKGPGTRMYERFWGTDVQDPVQWTRLGTQIAGGVGGASAGAAIGAGIGTAIEPGVGTGVGAAIGGAIGGFSGSLAGTAAPEATMQMAEYLGFAKPGFRKSHGLSPENLKTVMMGEGLLDMVTGGGIVAARQLLVRPGIRLLTGVTKARRALADEAGRLNINMLPVQLGDRAIPRGFVAVMGKFPLVAGPIRRRMISSHQMYQDAFENLPADIAPIATMSKVSHDIMIDGRATWTKLSKEYGQKYADIFTRADAAGAKVNLDDTAQVVLDITNKLKRETPSAFSKGKKVKLSEDVAALSSFINTSIRPTFKATKSGVQAVAPQTFQQMDRMLASIDVKIGEFGKNGWTDAMMRLEDIKNSIRKDMYLHVAASDPQAAAKIGLDFQAVDKAYSNDVATLFETSVAKKFGTVRKGGIRGANFDTNTRTNIDNLAETLMRGESPDDLRNLAKIVRPETFKSMAAATLEKRIQDAWVPIEGETGKHTVDVEKVAKDLGFNAQNGKRFEHTKTMLELAGGLKVEDVGRMLEMGKRIKSIDIPNPSTFISRRATMAGIGAIFGGIFMTDVVAKHPVASASGLVTMLMTIGGSRFLGHVITDPLAARSLKYVLAPETSKAARKATFLRMVQAGARASVDAGDLMEGEAMNMIDWFRKGADYADQQDTSSKVPSSE